MQQRLSQFRITSKLIAAFALMFGCTVALGVFSVARVTLLTGAAAEIGTDVVASAALGQVAIDGERMLSLGLARQATASSAAKTRLTNQLEAAAHDLDANWLHYVTGGPMGAEEHRLAAAVQRAWKGYSASLQEAAAMDAAGNNDEAETYLEDTVPKAVAAFRQTMEATVAFKRAQSTAAVSAAAWVGASARVMIISILAAMAAASGAIAWFMIGAICKPVSEMTVAMQRLAGRDMQVEVPGTSRGDEIGRMAAAVLAFKNSMLVADRLAVDRDVEQQIKERRSTKLEALLVAFEDKATGLVDLLEARSSELNATADAMTTTASQTDQRASTVSSAATLASTEASIVATATDQLAASIGEINRQVSQSIMFTGRAVSETQRTSTIVRDLALAADKIGNVVNIITRIASQTSLLALNATIEAARAGHAGRGFAVVASEVKTLAVQTTKATSEIGIQVDQIQSATRDAVSAINTVAKINQEVNGIATVIASSVAQQSSATSEIVQSVHQTAQAASDVTENICEVRHASKQVQDAAGHVLEAAGGISEQAVRLSKEVNWFLKEVRAA